MKLSRRTLIMNIGALYLLQASNYLISFFSIPYLARVLDVAGYGAYSYSVSINAYVWMFVDWGFAVGAVRAVAQSREDHDQLKSVFWRTIFGRLILAPPAALLLVALGVFGHVNHPGVVIASGLIAMTGAVMACDWMVQGMERMGLFLVLSVATRLATLALTLALVRHPSDLGVAVMVQGVGGFMAGALGLAVAVSTFKMGLPRLKLREAASHMWSMRHYFVARSNALFYVSAAPVMLGLLSTPIQLGTFAGADKIVRISLALIAPLTVALAPRVFAVVQQSKEQAGAMSGKILIFQFIFTSGMAIGLFVCSNYLATIILGPGYESSAALIRLLAPLPILVGLTSALSNQFLVPLGHARALSRFTVCASIIYLAGLFVFCRLAGARGAAIAHLTAEGFLICGYFFLLLLLERKYLAAAFSFRSPAPPAL